MAKTVRYMITSWHEKLLLILVSSLQAYLLLARSIGIAEEPTPETVGNDSPCSPDQYLRAMDQYYNELYTANVANSFNGNMMYYALRAMQAHENRTEPAPITEEDYALIENIRAQGRFIPAGMETANKVICARILQELDKVVRAVSTTALCPWNYACNYKPDRFPKYLFSAQCLKSLCGDANCSQRNRRHSECKSQSIYVVVLKMKGSCGSWTWGEESVTLACTCSERVT